MISQELAELNAEKAINGWLFMGGVLSGLAHVEAFVSFAKLSKDDRMWEGEISTGDKGTLPFYIFAGNPERDAILSESTPEKIYIIKRSEVPLGVVADWDQFLFIPVSKEGEAHGG